MVDPLVRQPIDYASVTVSIGQVWIRELIRRNPNAQLTQLVDESNEKTGVKATPRDDDTFLKVEKGVFILTNR